MLKNFERTKKNGYKTDLLKKILRQISNSNEKNIKSFFHFKKLEKTSHKALKVPKTSGNVNKNKYKILNKPKRKKKNSNCLKNLSKKIPKKVILSSDLN
jgi:hypothetical protein